jgi:hypothetical protein
MDGHRLAPVSPQYLYEQALRDHGIEVTAIHNHMLDDQPQIYFMNFWANDDARKLAEGLKAALSQINIAKS